MEDRETSVFSRKPAAEPKKGIRSCKAIALTSVISKWYAACVILLLEKEKELGGWKKLQVGEIEGLSSQHFQVMVTILLQKHWVWQEDRRPTLKHGSVQRPTMYLGKFERQGEDKAHCTNYGGSQCSWMDYCSLPTRDG